MNETRTSELLTPREVARELRVSMPTLYRRISDGQLAAVRVGEDGPLRVRREAVSALLHPAVSDDRVTSG
jgi:excisionase family DNA binding protein